MVARFTIFLAAFGLMALGASQLVLGAPATEKAASSGSRYRSAEKKKAEEGRLGKSKAGSAASGDMASKRAASEREKLTKTISARLDKFMPAGKAKKGPDDHFIVGTSEVRLAESQADVRFESVQGQKEVAERLADYVVSAPPQTLRQWHIFARVKTDQEAEGFLRDLRIQWDALEQAQAEQARLAQTMSLAYRSASDLRRRMGGYARSICRT